MVVPRMTATVVPPSATSSDGRAPYTTRAKTSRPFEGSMPSQCSALIPLRRKPPAGAVSEASRSSPSGPLKFGWFGP